MQPTEGMGTLKEDVKKCRTARQSLENWEVRVRRTASSACGEAHTLVVTEKGEAWAWGAADAGQLGLNSSKRKVLPERINFFHDDAVEGWEEYTVNQEQVDAGQSLNPAGTKYFFNPQLKLAVWKLPAVTRDAAKADPVLIKMIAGGAKHSAAVTTKGALCTWGCGTYHQFVVNGNVQVSS